MLNQIKKKLGFPYSKEIEAEFRAYMVKQRYKPLLMVVLGVLALLCLLIIWGYFFPDDLAPPAYHANMMLIHSLFFVFTIIILALSILLRKQLLEYPVLYSVLVISYAVAICMWGTTIAAYTVWSKVLTSAFVSVSLCLAVVLVLKPWQAFLLFFGNFSYYVVLVAFVWPHHDLVSVNISNACLATLLSIAIASVFYRLYARTFYDQLIIQKQMEQISKVNRKLKEQVHIDGLTGLHNRRFFDETLPGKFYGLLRSQKTVAAIMADIDFFKEHNDRYGHLAGDDCIRGIAAIIREIFESEEAYSVRYGGEEFFILIATDQREDIVVAVEHLREAVEKADIAHDKIPTGHVTISVGLAFARQDDDFELVTGRADEALYQAKSKGRNQVVVAE